MFILINEYALYPQSVMLPLAGAFFAVIACRRLRSRLACSWLDALAAVAWSGAAALAVSRLWGGHEDPDAVIGAQASLAAYWGVFAAMIVWALARRKPVGLALNTIAPAVMAGGAVARAGCVFAGCCRGYGWLFFDLWPLYDIAAILAALALGLKLEKRKANAPLLAFLIVYGLLRFALEFARPVNPLAFGLTSAQLIALAQAGGGFALLVGDATQSRPAPDEAAAQDNNP